ncbi:hypothetical protein DL546_008290 [Coniochaeta pulveracea]|uniref:Uncharacterized protein n=1 Tax=Coniochaeta pulveracea TaxID=177199 RepID=A0A420YDQ2_9PEZI|nr:hypothetical protein DL546_008290 [Coniochaeta pulveracea]
MPPLSSGLRDVAQAPGQQARQGTPNWIAIYITIPLIVLTGVAAIIGWTIYKRKRAKRNRRPLTLAELAAQEAQAEAIYQSQESWFRDLENYWSTRRDNCETCDQPQPSNSVQDHRQSRLLPPLPGSVAKNNSHVEEIELTAWPSTPETIVAAAPDQQKKKRSGSDAKAGITVVKPKQSAINLRTGLPAGITVENVRDPKPDKDYNWRSVQRFRGRDGKIITDPAEISKLRQLMICNWVAQPDPSVESFHAGPSEPPASHDFGYGGRRPSDEQPLAPYQPISSVPSRKFSAPVVLGSKPYADSPLAMADAEANSPYDLGSPYEEHPGPALPLKKRKKGKKRQGKELAPEGFVDSPPSASYPQHDKEIGYTNPIDPIGERARANQGIDTRPFPASEIQSLRSGPRSRGQTFGSGHSSGYVGSTGSPRHPAKYALNEHRELRPNPAYSREQTSNSPQPISSGDGYFSELARPKPAYCHDPTGAMPATPSYPTSGTLTGGRRRAHTRAAAITNPEEVREAVAEAVAEALSSPIYGNDNPFSSPIAEQLSSPAEASSSRPEAIIGQPGYIQPFGSPNKEASAEDSSRYPGVQDRDMARTPSPTEEEVRIMREQTRRILTGQATPTPMAPRRPNNANKNERYP